MMRQLARVLLLVLGFSGLSCESAEGECPVGDETCAEDEIDASLGLNALSVHIAAVTGQLNNIQQCGSWCAEAEPTVACRMDTSIVACQGDFHCSTTCGLWDRMILTEKPFASCGMFRRFDGYGTHERVEPCDTSCMLPELRPHRYPAPTGLGLMCTKGTCLPIFLAQSKFRLECPCNWFGSDCDNDWFPIETIDHTDHYGSDPNNAVVATTLTVAKEHWHAVLANHQPGGVVRLVHRENQTDWVQEQPYALAFALEEGKIQILTAPPDQSLHIHARAVAERVRSLPSGPIDGGNLYINPSIAGFFNSQWQFLLQFLDSNPEVKNVVLLSTGAGLSGSISAIQALLPRTTCKVHVYHGVRRLQDLPFQDYFQQVSSEIRLTIVESQPPTISADDLPSGVRSAFERGREMRRLLANDGGKLYVQTVLQHDLGTMTLEDSIFVACGRLALLEETKEMLLETFCSDGSYPCNQAVGQHFFTNI